MTDRAGRPASDCPPVTIIIPAHNEASVITRCLTSVLKDAKPGEFDVLVVSNGSTDMTAARARDSVRLTSQRIDVLEIPTSSKIAALRAADEHLAQSKGGVRIYLDADVMLSTHAARMLVESLEGTEPRLALARIVVDTSMSSRWVREYYRAWLCTSYIKRQQAGSGVFAVNETGAARIRPLPDLISDDGYVAQRFSTDERHVCDASFTSYAARSTRALIRRRARTVNGMRQLKVMFPNPEPWAGPAGTAKEIAAAVQARDLPMASALAYVGITISARILAALRRLAGTADDWSTDATTRVDTG